MNQNTKRLLLLNLPYVLMGLYATNLGLAWRLAVGTDFSEKMQSLMTVLPDALGRIVPSFHPLDLIVGLCCGAGAAAGGVSQRQKRQEVPPRQRVRLGPLGQCQGHRAVCGPQV